MFTGILQSQLSQGSLSQSDIKATVCGLKEVFALLFSLPSFIALNSSMYTVSQ